MIIVDGGQDGADKLEEDDQVLIDPRLLPSTPRRKLDNPLHDMCMSARMYAGHRQIQVRVCFNGDGLAGVLGGDVVEYAGGREEGAVFVVTGDPDSGRLVVLVVGDRKVKSAGTHNTDLRLSRCGHKLRLNIRMRS